MPLLAAFLGSWLTRLLAYMTTKWGAEVAIRMAFVAAIAAVYVALLVAFNSFVEPLLSALFSTGYGTVIGLAFPPIAGTVVTGLAALWVSVVSYRYLRSLGMSLVK